jgi:hypothetical protein
MRLATTPLAVLVAAVAVARVAGDPSSFASDEACVAGSAAAAAATGADVVAAMRSGYWGCAEALATAAAASGTVLATDINNMVALESRAINMKISALRSSLESANPPSQIIHPAFLWAQSGDSIFLNVKFAHKIDAPATLDVNVDSVKLDNTSVSLRASKERKAFELDLSPLRHAIDPDASSWTLGSVGRAMFTLKKAAAKPKKWPGLLAKNAKKPAGQMGVWWDRQEEFTKELDKLEDDDDDDEDGGGSSSSSSSKKEKKEKKSSEKKKKKKKKEKKPGEGVDGGADSKESAELREARLAIEKELKAQILELEEEAKKQKDAIDLDTKTRKAAIDAEAAEKRSALEEDAKQKKADIAAAAEEKENAEWAKTAFDDSTAMGKGGAVAAAAAEAAAAAAAAAAGAEEGESGAAGAGSEL